MTPCRHRASAARARLLLVGLPLLLIAEPARGAFDLRRASPDALGAASSDLPFDPLETTMATPRGWVAEATHGALFDVPGLASDEAVLGWRAPAASLDAAWSRHGTPDLAEVTQALAVSERGSRAVRLHGRAERIALRVAGDSESAGWTAGAGVTGRISRSPEAPEVVLDADRAYRSGGAERLGVAPSVVVALRVHREGILVAAVDRWERNGRRSPRLAVRIRLAPALSLRAARGGGPGRMGVAVTVRWRHFDISAGRMDFADGGSVSAWSVRFTGVPGAETPSEAGTREPFPPSPPRCWTPNALLSCDTKGN